jgi:integrase
VKEIDFISRIIVVRDGKGQKDRRTMLPKPLTVSLEVQMQEARRVHESDLRDGFGDVWLPHALERKDPNANRSGRGSTCSRRRTGAATLEAE